MRPLAVAAAATLLLGLGAASCGDDRTPEVDPDLGGAATRQEITQNAFGLSAPTLTHEERRTFEVGDSFFTQSWVTAPASTDARDGLGPTMNAQACSSCHVRDGRGAPPGDDPDDHSDLGLLLRLSVPGQTDVGGPVPDPAYGGQLQDRAVLDVPPEGRVQLTWTTEEDTYEDGTPYELRRPDIEIVDLAYGPLADDVLVSARLAPQVVGMGLLEAVPDQTLLDAADPDDEDGDGISGRPNVVWDQRAEDAALGRFGWKANVATVEQQSAGAFHGDLGITTDLHPDQPCEEGQEACLAAPDGGSPEADESVLGAVTFYGRTLAVPAARDVDDPEVREGAGLFEEVGCASCHTTTLETGESDVAALSEQTIHPYTDLLLHDMGAGLADGRPDFEASGTEWRTPPLWGIGLIEAVNGERFLLHDGRARTLEEAILWHGGEADAAREAFRSLPAEERAALVRFLEAL